MPPATVIHVMYAVIIAEHELIDWLRAVDHLADERTTQQVAVRPLGTIGNRYTNATHLAGMHIVRPEEQIVTSRMAYDGRCPHGPLGPTHFRRVEDGRMLRPSHQVLGRETVEEHLVFVHIAPRGINPIRVIVNDGLRIGIPTTKYRVAAHALHGTATFACATHQQGSQAQNKKILFHKKTAVCSKYKGRKKEEIS